jgi:hypothetical protein
MALYKIGLMALYKIGEKHPHDLNAPPFPSFRNEAFPLGSGLPVHRTPNAVAH